MRDYLTRKCGFMATLMAFLMLIPLVSCQQPQPSEDIPVLKVSPESLGFAGSGGPKTLTVEAGGAWRAYYSPWVKMSQENGAGNKTITVVASENTNTQPREGDITFYLTAYEDVRVTVKLSQAEKGGAEPDNPDDEEEDEPEGEPIPRNNFSEETDWGVTGSIMNLNWGQDGAKDIPMLADIDDSGWMACFDVVVAEGEQFKFRMNNDWATNYGSKDNKQPKLDRKYLMADGGGNFELAAGTYDLYINTQGLLYVETAGAEFKHGDAMADAESGENVRIFVLNNSTWTKPYMYAYVGSGELQPYGQWPGLYASGTKQFGEYTWTYWEASGFNGVNGINLILNNNGAEQYPAPDETEPLWSNLTILNNLFFVWDGTKVTQVEDPANPGVTGTGKTPDVVKFGSSSWTIIGTLEGTDWDTDFPMDTEGYWEVARDVTVASGEMFKFRQNRSWGSNYGCGAATPGTKLEMVQDGDNITVAPGTYDIYLAAENRIAYILTAGSAWTHEAEGKPEYSGEGEYDPDMDPKNKLSGITYQINIFSFKDSDGDGYGDLNGIAQSLDYFDKLGVTGLWLSPIHPAQSYHGYDVMDYEAIYKRYGTEEDFQNLINQAHQHNIRIYMDYVINHAGDNSVWFNDVKEKGTKSEYWDYFSLSKNPEADIKAGKIAQVDPIAGFDKYKWYPVLIGGKGEKRFKIELDWTNASAPKMTVTETTEAPTTSGTYNNAERYLYWGNGIYSQFADNGTNKYKLVLDYQSAWGCLVRTTKQDVWTGKTKWGFNKTGDQMQLGVAHTLYSDDNPDNVQSIVMPGGELYYYYTEFGTGMFVDFNYGPANSCANSNAFKAIVKTAEKWLNMGVDGFRLDAVKHIYHNETGPENKAFWKAFYNACNSIYKGTAATSARAGLTGWKDPNIFMVGEVLSGDGDCTPFYEGLPALFEFQFFWDLRNCLNGETINNAGYGQNFPGSLSYRWNNHRGVRADAISTPKLANHDEDRTASQLGNYKPKIRLAACVLLTSAGRPYIYQGEELGYWGTKAGGDEYVRTPILWTASQSSAASKGVSNKVDWNMLQPSMSVESQSSDDASLLSLYRHFAYARNNNKALADGWPEADERTMGGYDSHIAGWYLHANDGSDKVVLVMHNFSSSTTTVSRWPGENATQESIVVSNGKVTVSGDVSTGTSVTMPAYSSVVFALN